MKKKEEQSKKDLEKKSMEATPLKKEVEAKGTPEKIVVMPKNIVDTKSSSRTRPHDDKRDAEGKSSTFKEDDLEKNLESIYTDKEGNLPDFTKLDGKPGSKVKSFILGALLFIAVLGGVTWGGLWYFGQSGGGFTGDGVALSFDSDDSLTTGMPTEITVHYRNNEAIPLASSTLSLDVPEGFVLLEALPPPNEEGEWPIGSISPGSEGEVILKGWVRGAPEDALTFRGELTYQPADFSSTFERLGSHTVIIDDTSFKVVASGPEQLTPGDEVEFTYTYSSTSTMAIDGLEFHLDAADGFIMTSSEPAPDTEGETTWTIPTLEKGVEDTILVRGTFSSDARGPKRIDGTLGFSSESGFITAAQGSVETEVLKSALAVGMIVNGSTENTTATFGELLNFSVTYSNEGDVNLRDVEISANLPSRPGELLDWISLEDENNGERKGSVITWTSEEIEALKLLEPGDEGIINFSVTLINNPIEGSSETRYGLDTSITAKIGRVGTIARDREVTSTPLAINLSSNTVFKAFGRYFNEDGIPLGAGPIPPKVGETTTYRVFWVIENSLHELTNLSIETILPQGAKWAGTERLVEAGELSFDSSGRKATWRLNKLPTSIERVTIMFDVEYTPEFEDVGQIIEITDDIRFEALDKETESVILITEKPVDSSLPADDEASGKGVVQE